MDEIIIYGGVDHDNDMDGKFDYMDTIIRAIQELRIRGLGSEKYSIYSNSTIRRSCYSGRHIFHRTFDTEYEMILREPQIEEWIIDEDMDNILIIKNDKGVVKTQNLFI